MDANCLSDSSDGSLTEAEFITRSTKRGARTTHRPHSMPAASEFPPLTPRRHPAGTEPTSTALTAPTSTAIETVEIAAVSALVASLAAELAAVSGEPLQRVVARKPLIARLRVLFGELSAVHAAAAAAGAAADAAVAADADLVLEQIGAAPRTAAGAAPRTAASAAPRTAAGAAPRTAASAPRTAASAAPRTAAGAQPVGTVTVPGTHMKVRAVVAATATTAADVRAVAATAPGELVWVPAWSHFAFVVGGELFHAGLGRVYAGRLADGETPERVRACRHASVCTDATCRFYHDPATTGSRGCGGDQVRNFIADSFLYAPLAGTARPHQRRVACQSALDYEARAVDAETSALLADQAAHDVIVALVVKGCQIKKM